MVLLAVDNLEDRLEMQVMVMTEVVGLSVMEISAAVSLVDLMVKA